ncbi:hypothetical protein [Treponema sp.]|uniref:hypothetical protein n=1 Tax=Treponema sp. TaxID=166 RepID=UPI0025E08867|nr:hypothetical protein [Treponema sp.]MCR5219343.1 hypothetical protein [Treponema sp.]
MKINKKTFAVLSLTAVFAASSLFTSCNDLADDVKVEPSDWSEGKMTTSAYLMSSIGPNKYIESDALHLSYSEDGLTWTTLNSNEPVFTSTIGSCHFRDPCIFRLNDGSFVLLAADFTQSGKYWDLGSRSDVNNYWNHPSNCIIVAFSDDLVNWKNEHKLQITNATGTDGATRHVWTPRAMYNKQYKCYDIYWVGDNNDGTNMVYVSQTYDFYSVKSLSPELIYSPGYSVTAAYIVKDSDYYLFARDADKNYATFKGGDIQVASTDSWGNHFNRISDRYINRVSDQLSVEYVEYPCVFKLEDDATWVMIVNQENSPTTWSTYATTDISDNSSWVEASSLGLSFTLPDSNIDASVCRITEDELNTLIAAF